jgi:diguanylate cyclase (GGDEF)-like protein/PAS domain S-box-containing protein
MSSRDIRPSAPDEKLPALVEALRDLVQQIDGLTAGKLDAVAGLSGDLSSLRRAKQHLRGASASGLDASLQYWRDFIDALGPTVFAGLLTPDGILIEVNRSSLEAAGLTMDQVIGKPFVDTYWWSHSSEARKKLREAIRRAARGESSRYDAQALGARGQHIEVDFSLQPVRNEAGEVVYLVPSASVVTGKRLAELALQESEAKIKRLNRVYSILSQINTLIVRVPDRAELFQEACRIAVEQGGFRMAMINIMDPASGKVRTVASAGKHASLLADIRTLLESPAAESSMTLRAIRSKHPVISHCVKDDAQVLLGPDYVKAGVSSIAVIPLIVAGEGVGVVALYAEETDFFHEAEVQLLTELAGDISFALDHIQKQDRLHYLAYYDSLTGLANRSLFMERVEQHMRAAATGNYGLAVGIVDIERFKNINDSLGQTAGDVLLNQVAQWLAANVGGTEFLARIDADHFAWVLPQVSDQGNIHRLIEKKMAAFMEHSFNLNGALFRIAFKTGVALFPANGANPDILYKNAEAALKKAKAGGDPYLFFTEKMTATVASRLALENQMREAIKNNEFVLHYQPKFDLSSGKLTGAEALIRWHDPQTGLVPPGQFIPILEETGLIHEVGRWALRQAADDHLRWQAAGFPAVRIAVNVSPLQLRNRSFVNEIQQVIGSDGIAANGLELEITESVIMADVEHSATLLAAVRSMGLSVAIDDFGTGFSSLSYLSKLPVDTLKIDRSFVVDLTGRPEGMALVATIVNLAHSLRLKVVAEGVETEEQARLLRGLNCDQVQGFLFSKPLPVDEFEKRFLKVLPSWQ